MNVPRVIDCWVRQREPGGKLTGVHWLDRLKPRVLVGGHGSFNLRVEVRADSFCVFNKNVA